MIALLLFILPLLGGFVFLLFRPDSSWKTSLFFSLGIFLLSGYLFFGKPEVYLKTMDVEWVPSLGIHFQLKNEGIASVLVLLTGLLFSLIIFQQKERGWDSNFFGLMFLMQAGLNGVFMAADAILFYVCWELVLIPIYLICLLYGGKGRERITLRFFLFTVLGSLCMLAGFIYLYMHSGQDFSQRSFSHPAMMYAGNVLTQKQQIWVFLLIFSGFAVKIPLVPLHVWQPSTYTNAPYAGTMLLSGLMAKMGIYGFIYWLVPSLPLGHQYWSSVLMLLSVVTILFAAISALRASDFKELLSWSSLSHMGMMAAGVASLKEESLSGAGVMMFSHGLTGVGLFVIADILERHTGTTRIDQLGGIRSMNGQFSNLFLIVLLGSVALPLTSGFPGEFLLLSGIYQYSMYFAFAAALSVILGAVYMFRAYQGIMLGEPPNRQLVFRALSVNDKWTLFIIAFMILLLGVYPNIILDKIQENIHLLISMVK